MVTMDVMFLNGGNFLWLFIFLLVNFWTVNGKFIIMNSSDIANTLTLFTRYYIIRMLGEPSEVATCSNPSYPTDFYVSYLKLSQMKENTFLENFMIYYNMRRDYTLRFIIEVIY